MGTAYAIQADCPQALPERRVEAELSRLDRLLSTYDPDSELSRFNAQPPGVAVPVSDGLGAVVDAAVTVAEETDGAFDPTVAPLVALWGFGAQAVRATPDDRDVAEALAAVDYRRVVYQDDPPRLRKAARAHLDLSAIGKGYAVDRLADLLDDAQCRSFLIEFGGEIRVSGSAPGGGPWRLGVESPSGSGLVTTIALETGSLATSGDYRQYREHDGGRVSHVIDPRTGYPIRHRLASVTVLAETAAEADAYATALLVMGDREGMRFADATGLAALFVVRAERDFEVLPSRAMVPYLPG